MDRSDHLRKAALCGAFLCTAIVAAADDPAPSAPTPRPTSPPVAAQGMVIKDWGATAPSSDLPFAALVGSVNVPGTYELPPVPLTIAGLIQRAGGLNDAGSGIRIDRKDRSIHLSGTAAELEYLAPGDVVVIAPPAGRQPAAGAVAVLGLLEFPVVIPLTAEGTHVSDLLGQLRQSPECLLHAQTRPPLGHRLMGNALLESGAVVVLDRRYVRPLSHAEASIVAIPRLLTEPQGLPEPAGHDSELLRTPSHDRRMGHSLAQSFMDDTADLPAEAPETEDLSGDPFIPQLPDEEMTEQPAMPLAEMEAAPPPPPAEELAPTSAKILTPAAAVTPAGGPPPVIDAAPVTVALPVAPTVVIAPPVRVTELEAASAGTMGAGRFWPMFGFMLIGISGIGVLTSWWIRNARARSARIAKAREAAIPFEDIVSDLIHNRLPIDDEPIELPSRLQWQGRVVGGDRLIVHPPQPLNGPHFTTAPRPSSAPAAAARGGAPAGRRHDASPQDGGLLERVLLAMDREGRR